MSARRVRWTLAGIDDPDPGARQLRPGCPAQNPPRSVDGEARYDPAAPGWYVTPAAGGERYFVRDDGDVPPPTGAAGADTAARQASGPELDWP
jgi:hypothetical protein